MGCCSRLCHLIAFALGAACIAPFVLSRPPRLQLPADRSACAANAWSALDGQHAPNRSKIKFDIVLFGATGFTGELLAWYLAERPGSFTYALAGRSMTKMNALATSIRADPARRPPKDLLFANADSVADLRSMAQKARVVLTAAGPYTKYGSNLVQVCAEEGVHYADLSGEFLWQREMVERFHATAVGTGAKIVVAAGFDSVPSDLGASLAFEKLETLSRPSAPEITITTAVLGMRGWMSGGTLQAGIVTSEKIAKGDLPEGAVHDPYLLVPFAACRVDQEFSGWGKFPYYDRTLGAVGVPFFMAAVNARIVRRTMALLGRHGVSYAEGQTLGGILDMVGFLAKYMLRGELNLAPKAGDGPSPSMQKEGGYEMVVLAQDAVSGKTATVLMEGRGDPGYSHTSKLQAEVGLCLLDEQCWRRGVGGGVLTPASALDANALSSRLKAAKHSDGRPLLSIRVKEGGYLMEGEL